MDDWDPIPLSRLSHAGFCLRRAALLTNEQVWSESADTAKGRSEHERVHTQRIERRGDSAKLYEFPVYSHTLGVAGKCDCIEAEADIRGCRIPALDFPVRLYPVEYKHGKLRAEQEYEIQLCAQAMCLEEMFQTHITEGTIYPLLLRLEKNKWVHATYQASDLGPKRKYYALTPQGEQALTDFLSSYAELSKAIHTLICGIQGGTENEQTNQTTAE